MYDEQWMDRREQPSGIIIVCRGGCQPPMDFSSFPPSSATCRSFPAPVFPPHSFSFASSIGKLTAFVLAHDASSSLICDGFLPSEPNDESASGRDSNLGDISDDDLDGESHVFTFSDVDYLASQLQECNDARDLINGEYLHAHIISCGLESDRYLSNLLVLLYGNCGSMESAHCVFCKITSPNVYSWNILINAYAKNDELHMAEIAFGSMQQRNVASWNAIISALAQSGNGKDALGYYQEMYAQGVAPDPITFASVIDACADTTALEDGLKIHASVVDYGFLSNIIVVTALINMYGQCGKVEIASGLFQLLPQQDLFSWTAMIAAYVKNGCNDEAFSVFHDMCEAGVAPSRATFLALLEACGNLVMLSIGYDLHTLIILEQPKFDILLGNALINMYGKCKSPSDAIFVFHKMLDPDVVSWTSVIVAHAANGQEMKAMEIFYEMIEGSLQPNDFTFSVILDVCTRMQYRSDGLSVHSNNICRGMERDVITTINLINMYGKCRMLDEARAVFDSLVEPEAVAWNAMLSVYIRNGNHADALALFGQMTSMGFMPNPYTLRILQSS